MTPFVRPKIARPQAAPAVRPSGPPAPAAPPEGDASLAAAPQAVPAGTWLALAGIAITAVALTGQMASDVARFAAIGVGVSLAGSALLDAKRGFRNLIRADLLAILAFYFLTLFEFLFSQPDFDRMTTVETTRHAVWMVLVGFVGLLVGRHCWRPKQQPLHQLLTRELPPRTLVLLFWCAFALGFLHMFLAVNFDVAKMVDFFMAPRFTQPWQRGRLGDWKALLVELSLFIYLLPPIGGIVWARRARFSGGALAFVTLGVAFTFFYSFTSGTRNLFAAHLVTFVIGYAFAAAEGRRKELMALTSAAAAIMLVATVVMLEFRNVGFKNWMKGNVPPNRGGWQKAMFVDYNLYSICALVEVFPNRRDFLGWEVPFQAVIRPIPRAIWPGKPEGLSVSMEEALGLSGLTVAASFAGEAYMAGGWLTVLVTAGFFGALAGWWSFLASPRNSEVGILIYASGFFAAVISMRSLFAFTTALLPTLSAITLGWLLVRQVRQVQQRLQARAARLGNPGPRRGPATGRK